MRTRSSCDWPTRPCRPHTASPRTSWVTLREPRALAIPMGARRFGWRSCGLLRRRCDPTVRRDVPGARVRSGGAHPAFRGWPGLDGRAQRSGAAQRPGQPHRNRQRHRRGFGRSRRRTWTVSPVANDLAKDLPSRELFDVATAGSDLVAIGQVDASDGGTSGAAWWSSDRGATWTRLADGPNFAGGALGHIVSTRTGFLVFGGANLIWVVRTRRAMTLRVPLRSE